MSFDTLEIAIDLAAARAGETAAEAEAAAAAMLAVEYISDSDLPEAAAMVPVAVAGEGRLVVISTPAVMLLPAVIAVTAAAATYCWY